MRTHIAAQDNQGLHRILAAQWKDYLARRAEPDTDKNNYGVFGCMADGATHIDYFCGAPSKASLPVGFVELLLPPMRCAVFSCTEPVSGLRDFVHTIFRTKLPAAGLSLLPSGSGTPEFIERYLPDFDHSTLEGGLEILVPVKQQSI